jgi:hypothetical protein
LLKEDVDMGKLPGVLQSVVVVASFVVANSDMRVWIPGGTAALWFYDESVSDGAVE